MLVAVLVTIEFHGKMCTFSRIIGCTPKCTNFTHLIVFMRVYGQKIYITKYHLLCSKEEKHSGLE